MDGYFIRPTRVSPSIYFNPKKGLMDMRGRSCPENPLKFYDHLFDSLDKFVSEGYTTLKTNMAFEYFNTSSSKCLYLYLKKLSVMHKMGKKVVVNWFYEDGDEDMYESGEDLSSFFHVPFNFVKVDEIKILGKEREGQKSQLVA
ncbi:MAG: DUF1987 domain-containing protein [Cyclobacteriaceae bacterium]